MPPEIREFLKKLGLISGSTPLLHPPKRIRTPIFKCLDFFFRMGPILILKATPSDKPKLDGNIESEYLQMQGCEPRLGEEKTVLGSQPWWIDTGRRRLTMLPTALLIAEKARVLLIDLSMSVMIP